MLEQRITVGTSQGIHVKKSDLLRALQQEIRRHDFNYFVDQPPSIAQGGRGVVVLWCPACKKRIHTMSQFLDHLADDVLPALIERLSTKDVAIRAWQNWSAVEN
jgi:hypothetical protein